MLALPASRGEVVQNNKLTAVEDGEASCFYHPDRLATGICGACGVFVSDLWSAQWGSETVCLKCLERLRDGKPDPRFESRRVLWDNITLFIATVPLVLFFLWVFWIVTGPAALILSFYHRKKSGKMVPGFRWARTFTILFAVLQIVIWVLLVLAVFYS